MSDPDQPKSEDEAQVHGMSRAFEELLEQLREACKEPVRTPGPETESHGFCVTAKWKERQGLLLFLPVGEEYGLSPRQVQVACLLVRGYSHKEIKRILGIARNTVISHVRRVYDRTGTHSPVELAWKLFGRGLPTGAGDTATT